MNVERRLYPRYPLVFSVDVRLDSHNQPLEFNASSVNISKSSIEIHCDNALIDRLLAQDKYPHTCHLAFNIPKQDYLFEIEAQVVTHRRLSQNSYYLVLIFPDMPVDKSELLGEYLAMLESGGYLSAS